MEHFSELEDDGGGYDDDGHRHPPCPSLGLKWGVLPSLTRCPLCVESWSALPRLKQNVMYNT